MSDDLMKIASEQAKQGEAISNIEETCASIKTCLLGNGQPGLIVRTDRLEQRNKLLSRLFWVIVPVISALVVKALFPAIIQAMHNH